MIKFKNKKTERVKYGILKGKHLHIALCILLFCGANLLIKAQAISNNFYSENAWMPDSIGEGANKVFLNGHLHDNWENVRKSNVKLVRFGGQTADYNMPSRFQYLRMVDSIRAKGMEPILQLSKGNSNYDTLDALPIFRYINVTMNRHVKYWIIGNEPDLYTTNKTASKISAYIKRYAQAMKNIDNTILIIGPEMTSIKPEDSNAPVQKIVDSLMNTSWSGNILGLITSGSGAGKGFIDFFSWHMYNNYDGLTSTKSRSWLIDRLTTTDSLRMGRMKRKLDSCNIVLGRTSQPVKPIITEANICYYSDTNFVANDNWQGVKGNSFFAGQFWCEAMAIGVNRGLEWINFWSVMEKTGLGFMTNSTSARKSTYYHMQAMGQWYTGTNYLGSDKSTTSNADIKNLKAFGSKDGNHIAVFIMNQDSLLVVPTNRAYSIRLNGSYPSSDTNRITLSMGIDRTYRDTIEAASTTLLVFDLNGNISEKYIYKQFDGSTQPGFHQKYPQCGNSITYTQSTLDAYYPAVYSNITIGNGTNQIQVKNTDNSIFHAVNSITLNKNFLMLPGQTLSLIIDPTCQ